MVVRNGQAGRTRLNGYPGLSYPLRGHIGQCSMESVITGNVTEINLLVACCCFFVLVLVPFCFVCICQYALIEVFVTFHE